MVDDGLTPVHCFALIYVERLVRGRTKRYRVGGGGGGREQEEGEEHARSLRYAHTAMIRRTSYQCNKIKKFN